MECLLSSAQPFEGATAHLTENTVYSEVCLEAKWLLKFDFNVAEKSQKLQ